MQTIAIYNRKGGVGKTSTVINLTAELRRRGKSVLDIDLDAQCNLTTFYGADAAEKTVSDWLKKTAALQDVAVTARYGDLIPASRMLEAELLNFAAVPAFVIRIRELLAAIPKKKYDYVLIDCPPAVNQLTAAALVAADKVLIPTEAELFSVNGVGNIAEIIEAVKPLNPKLRVVGVLLVKYNPRRILTGKAENKLIEATRELLGSKVLQTKIRFTVDIPAAQASGAACYEYNPKSNGATDYAALADEIF